MIHISPWLVKAFLSIVLTIGGSQTDVNLQNYQLAAGLVSADVNNTLFAFLMKVF
jgi:hypothetical protein